MEKTTVLILAFNFCGHSLRLNIIKMHTIAIAYDVNLCAHYGLWAPMGKVCTIELCMCFCMLSDFCVGILIWSSLQSYC